MLLAAGGGFFSSSASGYSKGLTLLLFGQRNQEKPMRVTPWNQYHLVDHETEPNLQLASKKNRLVHGCAPFVCFGRTTAGPESPSPLKVGPTQNQEVLPKPLDFYGSKDRTHSVNPVVNDDGSSKIDILKSSLKKLEKGADDGDENMSKHGVSREKENVVTCEIDKRKVQWTDTSGGGELFEIREFDLSEVGSDDEFEYDNGKSCSCRIM